MNEGRRRKKKSGFRGKRSGMAMPSFPVNGFKIFSLFCIIFGQVPTKQIKITQNKQNKSNKTCGLPPTKRSFNVISLTIKRFLYPIPNLSQRDNGIKLTLVPKSHMAFLMLSDPYDTWYGKNLWILKFRWQFVLNDFNKFPKLLI